MNRVRTAAVLAVAALLAGGPAVRAQDAGDPGADPEKPANDPRAPLPIRVNQAIDAGVRWLMDKDNKPADKKNIMVPGNWSDEVLGNVLYDPNAKGDVYVHPTGCTSLSLYALLKSGVDKDDPVIQRGFQWLRTGSASMTKGQGQGKGKGKGKNTGNRIPSGTYEISVLILALEAKANPHKMEGQRERELKFRLKKGEKLNTGVKLPPEDEAWMKDLVAALVRRKNPGRGWRYGHDTGGGAFYNGPRGDSDLSASNLAMLAFLAGERCGIAQPDQFYVDMLRWTLTMQEKAGPETPRWDPTIKEEDRRYNPYKDAARGFGYLGASGADGEHVPTGSMTACGLANVLICTGILEARNSPLYTGELQKSAEKAWWDGIAWLDLHWSVDHNVNKGNYHYYYLYCLERACDLKRINLIAGHPWYNEGAQVLVDQQETTGAWIKDQTHEPRDVLGTCFALLFLNRATPAITGD